MAGAHCATTAVFPLSQPPKTTRITVSFISSPTPPKRKNYLRQKLLKTLTKPYANDAIPESPPTNPIIPTVSPREHDEGEARQEFEVSRPLETAGVLNGGFGFGFGFPSTRSVLKLGLFLVGAFAFQTVCAVMVFGSADSDRKDGNLGTGHRTRVLELGANGDSKGKSSALLDGNGDLFSGKLEEKIYEIQAMAREARQRDRLDSKSSGLEDDDDFKTGIEKEVERKLVKLRKRLQNSREKLPVFPVSYLGNEGEFEDGVGVDSLDENKPLMFRKKYKFRSPSTNPSIKPKGFQGSQNQTITRSRNSSSAVEDELMRKGSVDNDNVDLLGEGWLPEQENNNLSDDVSGPLLLEEDIGINLSKGKSKSAQTSSNELGTERVAKPKERGIGNVNRIDCASRQAGDKRSRNSWSQKSRKSSPIGSRNSWSQTKKVQATTIISNERDSFLRNDTLKSREGRSKGTTRKVEGKQSDDKAHKWWLSLPYVFAILMRTDHDGEGPKGLFTVKTNSYTMDKDGLSYTVAFEDRGDATNFCYLLQSFFEDLHNFSAEIVPLSIQELDEAVRSCTMKVIVVKKGQLNLYAGQPLAEVELALWSLVERS